MKIDFFTYQQVMELMYSTSGELENLTMDMGYFKIYQGVSSRIYIQIKNSDRRVVPAAGKTFIAYVVSQETDELMLKRELAEIDAASGQWELTLLEGETAEWKSGHYRLAVTIQDELGDEYNLYSDLNYSAVADIRLLANAMPKFKAATEIGSTDFQERVDIFYSSAYPGDAQSGRHDGLHTAAIYLNDFTGQIWVQGSLENAVPSEDTDWFDVTDLTFTTDTGIFPVDFQVDAQWIRFRYVPDIANTGEITKILYRI